MKKIYFISLLFFTLFSNAQNGITYQAMILNPKGEELPGADNLRSPLINQKICLEFKILVPVNQIEYQETITTTTDEFGMVNVLIGTGIQIGGTAANFAAVIWNGNAKNLLVSVDTSGTCNNFLEISNQPFTYVPYAFYAANSGTPGPIGATGPQGLAGTNGVNGAQGPAGIQGPIGANGAQGPIGLTGPQGVAGINGVNGIDGAQGPQGPIGLTGATGPQGLQGIAGLNGINGQTGLSAYQVWLNEGNTGTQAQFLTTLQGAQGIAGNNGANGTVGPQGLTGPAGIQGPIGLTGATGVQGIQGIAGTNGLSAYQVATANGFIGTEAQWLESLKGATGAQGASGTFQNGINVGDVLYWNGTNWAIVPIGTEGQNLTICNGVPQWGVCNNTSPIATISSITSCNAASTGSLYAGSSSSGVTQTINLIVATIGTYDISASANGVTFSASGTFTNTGLQNVVLTASGTPSTSGTFYYTLNTIPSCTFQISVLSTPVINFTDIDGNTYNTVNICSQTWMQSNLNVSHYRNGDVIPQVTDLTQWANLTTGAWCYYNNDTAIGAVYGKLYNLYAVKDPRGLAPQGWHIPTDGEWTTIVNCLGGENIAGGKMKEAGLEHWWAPNVASNESGFTALGSSYRNDAGTNFMRIAYFWSQTSDSIIGPDQVYVRALTNGSALISRGALGYNPTSSPGISVRCIKD